MGQIVAFALASAANPTLVVAATLMMLLPNPKMLMLGYLCGALLTSVTLGLVVVFAIGGSSTTHTTQHSLSPAADLGLAVLALVAAYVLRTGWDERVRARRSRAHPKHDKPPPRWQRALSSGSPRITFVVGALLTLPGASYLVGLHDIHRLHAGTTATVLIVIGFNVVMLLLLEVPLAGYALAPESTPLAIERAKAAVGAHWRRFAVIGLVAVGILLLAKGMVGLLS